MIQSDDALRPADLEPDVARMWGDYHLRELALLIQRLARGERYYTYFGPDGS
jgi:hypothetical protein